MGKPRSSRRTRESRRRTWESSQESEFRSCITAFLLTPGFWRLTSANEKHQTHPRILRRELARLAVTGRARPGHTDDSGYARARAQDTFRGGPEDPFIGENGRGRARARPCGQFQDVERDSAPGLGAGVEPS